MGNEEKEIVSADVKATVANDTKAKTPKKKGKEILRLITAVLVVGLLVGLLVWQRNREEEPVEVVHTPAQVIRLVDRTEDEIVKVVFQRQDGTVTMVPFEDEDGQTQWRKEGVYYQLDNVTARNKIRAAHNIFSGQIIHEDIREVPGLNLDDFGFNLVILTAHYTDGTTLNIYLGGLTPDLRGHYMMVEGNPGLFMISMPNAERFLLGLEDLLDTSLPEWETEAIQYLLVAERNQEPIEFIRQPHEVFEDMELLILNQPFHGSEIFTMSFDHHIMWAFSEFRLGDLVNIHPMDLSPYGLDDPSLEFIYHSLHGDTHLLFGNTFFRDVDGEETTFIYVKFADRPHVFEALYDPPSAIFGMNVLRFIERFVALVDIQTVERINVTTLDAEYEIYINHIGDGHAIEPTVNGIPMDVPAFRVVYRLLIQIGINTEVEPFTPQDEPIHTVLYTTIEDEENIYLRFYVYDDNFLGVSVNGEEIWYVVTRRGFDLFLEHLEELF